MIGFHEITLKTNTEEIKLSHNALDRKIFAEGAIFAAKKILNTNIDFGIHTFQEIVEKEKIKKKMLMITHYGRPLLLQ